MSDRRLRIGSPLMRTSPLVGAVTPASALSSVVLPAPLSPMIATNSPGAMLNVVGAVAADRQPVPLEAHRLRAHQGLLGGEQPRLAAAQEPQRIAADDDGVAVGQPARVAVEALAVELRAVLGAEVDELVAAFAR